MPKKDWGLPDEEIAKQASSSLPSFYVSGKQKSIITAIFVRAYLKGCNRCILTGPEDGSKVEILVSFQVYAFT